MPDIKKLKWILRQCDNNNLIDVIGEFEGLGYEIFNIVVSGSGQSNIIVVGKIK